LILIECKNNVLERIAPLVGCKKQMPSNLGIGAGGDPIKEIDLKAEQAVIETLVKHGISFTLVSEESGIKECGETPHEHFVTVDPIDGTTNLLREMPFYATSIAVSTEPLLSTVHTALVADLFHGEVYTAQKRKGARRGDHRIKPSRNTSLDEAVIGIDLNTYKAQEMASRLVALIQRTRHLRHFGANALELCYVADGRTDAFVDIRGKLRATDVAAAWLILQEAGGIITKTNGEELQARLDPKQKLEFVAAGNSGIHASILNLIKPEKEAR
jgi:myo-inositol-1(or 4)-monophosphatase